MYKETAAPAPTPVAPAGVRYLVGADLGQVSDPSALAVLEQRPGRDPAGRPAREFAARHLQRWPLGTAYPQIVADVCGLLGRLPRGAPWALAVDGTGVGRAVTDLFRARVPSGRLWRITITAGHAVTRDDRGGWRVPKRELVSVTQAALQTRRLKVAPALPEAATLVRELEAFQVRVTQAAHEKFEAATTWREGAHDDLVLAVAMAIWVGSRPTPGPGASAPGRVQASPPGERPPPGGGLIGGWHGAL